MLMVKAASADRHAQISLKLSMRAAIDKLPQPACKIVRGGIAQNRVTSPSLPQIWPRSGAPLADQTQMHVALRAVERAAFGLKSSPEALTGTRTNYTYRHDMLVSMLDRFGNDERQL